MRALVSVLALVACMSTAAELVWATPPTTLPGGRNFASAAFDAYRGRLVVHGGTGGSGLMQDTWDWTGQDWIRRVPSGGPNANFGAMVFDPTRNVTFFVGGAAGGNRNTPSAEIWSFAPLKPAEFTKYGAACNGTGGTPDFSGTDPWIGESAK